MLGNKPLRKPLSLLVLAMILVVLPFILRLYYLDILTILLINSILVISFRLIVTWGGYSLIHIPLMGLGAYATAIMVKTFGWPFWLTLPLSSLSVALVSWIISYPLVRTKLFGFFLASFAIGEAMRLGWSRLIFPFGGHRGITNIPSPESIPLPVLQTIDFGKPIPYYFLALVVTSLCLIIMYRLEKSRIVDTFKAINSEENLLKSIGISVFKYKTMSFVIGSFFAGIAGVIFAHHIHSISPSAFSFTYILYLLAWVIVGGTRTFAGPLIGLSVLTITHEWLRFVIDVEWIPMFYGFILIITLLFFPGGLENLAGKMKSLIGRIRI